MIRIQRLGVSGAAWRQILPSSTPRSTRAAAKPTPTPIPLYERAARHKVGLKDLQRWYAETMRSLDHDAATHDIPLPELQTELRWLLEDVVGQSDEDTPWTASSLAHGRIRNLQVDVCRLRLSLDELELLWERRLKDRVPIQYLTNTVHWRDVILVVWGGVLIPRPETEHLIDLAADMIRHNPELLDAPWADLGAGSGAIAVCLGRLLEDRNSRGQILAVDISPDCLRCTRQNAERLDVTARVVTIRGSWYVPLQPWRGKLAGIISNPPYIPSNDLLTLQPEVRRHESPLALDGGSDGLASLRAIFSKASEFLMPGGVLLLETNAQSQPSVLAQELNAQRGEKLENVEIHRDLYGKERFLTAVKKRSLSCGASQT